MEKNLKKMNKGITLVALVVTIIILLILAGITISQLTGSGLFENARLAEQKSKEAQELEDSILGDYENQINNFMGTSRDFGTSKELYRLDNPTWQPVTATALNDDVSKYKMLRIDFISCWWENTEQPTILGNLWVDTDDLVYDIAFSQNLADWYLGNTFSFSDNTFTLKYAFNWLWDGNTSQGNNNQTANIYRVVGYN